MAVVQTIQGLFDLKDFQGYFWDGIPRNHRKKTM
jgi:hypothetical protein